MCKVDKAAAGTEKGIKKGAAGTEKGVKKGEISYYPLLRSSQCKLSIKILPRCEM